jgi:pimeloyl-ACP methyl ester carboxylesterase
MATGASVMQQMSVQGQTIAFERAGNGTPFVFVHGLGASHKQSLEAVAGIQGIDLICPDMPGHGDTPPTRYTFRHFAALVLGMLDELGIERAVIGGISMGSGIALRLALDAPQRVERLALVRPAWVNSPALPQLALVGRVGRWQQEQTADAPDLLERDMDFRRINKINPAAAESIRGLFRRSGRSPCSAVLDRMVHDRPFQRMKDLESIACSAIVFASESDPLHPVGVAEAVFSALPNATYRLLPPRYLSPRDHFAAMTAELTQFLEV